MLFQLDNAMPTTLFPPVDGPAIAKALRQAAAERILILDGAMGTEIQNQIGRAHV